MDQHNLDMYRYFLKDSVRKTIDFSKTDQNRRVAPPPIEKPHGAGEEVIPLTSPADLADLYPTTLESAIRNRQSRRQFTGDPISLTDLSFLLWATQGIRQYINEGHALRTVPSAGARHAIETYLAVGSVGTIAPGFYRYLPVSHSILVQRPDVQAVQTTAKAAFGQNWMAKAAVIFIWASIPYRMEWRYGLAAHRAILLDAGHVCQNLYLACEAIGAGACAVAAYDQEQMDQLLGLDGRDEFVIYTAAVGRSR